MKKEKKNGTPSDRAGKQQRILSSCMMLFLTSQNHTKRNVPISTAVDSKKKYQPTYSHTMAVQIFCLFFFSFHKFLFNKFDDQHLF